MAEDITLNLLIFTDISTACVNGHMLSFNMLFCWLFNVHPISMGTNCSMFISKVVLRINELLKARQKHNPRKRTLSHWGIH